MVVLKLNSFELKSDIRSDKKKPERGNKIDNVAIYSGHPYF